MTAKNKVKKARSVKSVIAKSDDGTIQITFTIPQQLVEEKRIEAARQLGKDIDVPGFRKGNAPLPKIIEKIPRENLIQNLLSKILPKALGEVIDKEKLKIAIYPKFDLIKTDDNSDWQIRAITCEIPEISLGEYKKIVKGELAARDIWTPDKSKSQEKQSEEKITRQEKQSLVINTLLKNVKIKLPKLLIDGEVNAKLSQLLEKIEKLGLNLDSYLSSIGKNAQLLRSEYEEQAKRSISLDLILNKIATKEGVKVDPAQVEAAINASSPDKKSIKVSDGQRRIIEGVLIRQKALDNLINR